ISDYRKGTCSPSLLAAMISAAAEQGISTLVDPARGADYARYREASLLKPNRIEAQIASGVTIRRAEDALTVGRLLCQQSRVASILITLDAEGMALVPAGGKGKLISAHRQVAHDVTGAGDMVLAMLGLCRAAGVKLHESACLANVAAGLEVERFGVAQISRDEIRMQVGNRPHGRKVLSLGELVSRVEELRRDHRKIVFTNGCFDLLHAGHVRCLEEAARLGDVLIVAINSDKSVRELKGTDRPLIGAEQRAECWLHSPVWISSLFSTNERRTISCVQ
ncbi:MAG: PfkB family carbohydrate kinase, partial [Pirellulales bacterium]